MVVMTEDSYNRHAAYLVWETMTKTSETECAARMYKHKRTKTVSDNERSFFYFVTKWGLPKLKRSLIGAMSIGSEYSIRQRSLRSSPSVLMARTWRRKAVYSFQYKRKEGA